MSINYTTAVNNSRANALVTAAGTNCTLKLYSGSAPANANSNTTGTLLATFTISGALGTVSSGVITLSSIATVSAVATGTVGYARLATSAGTTICDFTSVGTSGSDINVNSTSISSGNTVSITSGTLSEPYP